MRQSGLFGGRYRVWGKTVLLGCHQPNSLAHYGQNTQAVRCRVAASTGRGRCASD